MSPMPIRHDARRLLAAVCAAAVVLAACGGVAPTVTPPGGSAGSAAPSAPGPSADVSAYPLPTVDLGGAISAEAISRHLAALDDIAQDSDGIRAAGTRGYDASVAYVASELRAFGWEVTTPEVGIPTFGEQPGGTLTVLDGGPTFAAPDDLRAMIYSPDGDVTAELATVGFADSPGGIGDEGCDADDWEAFPSGAIAVTPPGPCLRRDTVEHAMDAGAVALVVPNEERESGETLRPTLLFPDGIDIPVLSASREVGDALLDAVEGDVEVRISFDTDIGSARVSNVIAEHGSGEPVVMIGAHLDSVLDGPGINDNGSGAAAVLEIAHLLADAGHPGTVRVGFWAAEEFGLHGSRAYVTGEPGLAGDLSAYLNLDMLGSVNAVPMVYANAGSPDGSSAITSFLVAWLQAAGVPAETEDLGGGSDHFFFAQAGVPIGGIFSGATEEVTPEQAEANDGVAGEPMDACYHLGCDTVENVDAEQTATYAQAAAAAAMLLLSVGLPGF
jgi:Zn-dependent M28 family amino/carboxypeptidase